MGKVSLWGMLLLVLALPYYYIASHDAELRNLNERIQTQNALYFDDVPYYVYGLEGWAVAAGEPVYLPVYISGESLERLIINYRIETMEAAEQWEEMNDSEGKVDWVNELIEEEVS